MTTFRVVLDHEADGFVRVGVYALPNDRHDMHRFGGHLVMTTEDAEALRALFEEHRSWIPDTERKEQ